MRASRLIGAVLILGLCLWAPPAAAKPSPPADLFSKIERGIRSEHRLRVYDWIGFSVDGDEVTLSGFVSLPSLKASIEKRVLLVDGVDRVVNRLEILPLSRDDMGLRVNAYWRIYGNSELRRYARRDEETHSRIKREADDVQRVLVQPIHIIVRDGHITLEGEVEQERDLRVAAAEAAEVMGVRSVTNHLVVAAGNTEEHLAPRLESDAWWEDVDSVRIPSLRIENPSGATTVRVAAVERLRVRKSSLDREVRDGDVVLNRLQRKMRLEARPEDGARIDLDVDLPYGYRLEIETVDGPVRVEGLLRRARIVTGSGDVSLAAPWEAMRLKVVSARRPAEVALPAGRESPFEAFRPEAPGAVWTLTDSRDERTAVYGEIEVEAAGLGRLQIEDLPIPEDSPVRMHWEAPRVLKAIFRRGSGGLVDRTPSAPPPILAASGLDDAGVRFRSDVRLVDLTVAVTDELNRPLTGLGPKDFEVLEEGVRQQVSFVSGGDVPYNLALLLDCSTSTLTERFSVVEAARRFVSAARPQDRVAVYVLADNYFQVLSPLTADRRSLLRKIERIPPLTGATPLYDAIVLAYAQELASRKWERNALIVISDGMDNQILPPLGRTMPSKVSFEELKRAAAEMNALIYPIFLDPREPMRKAWAKRYKPWKETARTNLEQLAAASGGRLFRAPSLRSLDPVYREVAQELRSVYTLGYYPKNQDFDGAWRAIEVSVKLPAVRVRTRPGYYAW